MFKRILLLVLFAVVEMIASELDSTNVNRIEVVVTIAGMQKTVNSIENTSQQIVALTKQLSNKKDFTNKDHEVIASLSEALNNNAHAINNIALALPQQFEKAEGGINNIIDTTVAGAQDVINTSKNDLIYPVLERIENRVLIFILIVSIVLFGLLWYGLWKINTIASTGSKTVENIMNTVKSLEVVLEKTSRQDNK